MQMNLPDNVNFKEQMYNVFLKDKYTLKPVHNDIVYWWLGIWLLPNEYSLAIYSNFIGRIHILTCYIILRE